MAYPIPTVSHRAHGDIDPDLFCFYIKGYINLSVATGGGTQAQICVNRPEDLRPLYEALRALLEPATEAAHA